MPNRKQTISLAAALILAAFPAEAYIGPGAGAGTVAVVLGVLASIVMAFLAVLWYPVKRLLRNRRKARQTADAIKIDDAENSDGS